MNGQDGNSAGASINDSPSSGPNTYSGTKSTSNLNENVANGGIAPSNSQSSLPLSLSGASAIANRNVQGGATAIPNANNSMIVLGVLSNGQTAISGAKNCYVCLVYNSFSKFQRFHSKSKHD